MDREQEELQFLGFFGVCSESIKIISSWRKIFLQITLTLTFPLSILFLSNIAFSKILEGKIIHTQYTLDKTQQGTVSYNKSSNALSSEWTEFLMIKVFYFVFVLLFSLLSTSAVVYTVACIYSAKQITYKKVMSVVPKVWKRLIVTYLCNFVIIAIYNICFSLVVAILWLLLTPWTSDDLLLMVAMVPILIPLYIAGLSYISVIWHLACVISVLEDRYGFKAMVKSKALIKGKMILSIGMYVVVNFFVGWVHYIFERRVISHNSIGILGKVGVGVIFLGLLCIIFLFGLVVQSVIYFVCKSYHHENIDKSILSDHLEVYLGDYVPLTAKDIQMEHI